MNHITSLTLAVAMAAALATPAQAAKHKAPARGKAPAAHARAAAPRVSHAPRVAHAPRVSHAPNRNHVSMHRAPAQQRNVAAQRNAAAARSAARSAAVRQHASQSQKLAAQRNAASKRSAVVQQQRAAQAQAARNQAAQRSRAAAIAGRHHDARDGRHHDTRRSTVVNNRIDSRRFSVNKSNREYHNTYYNRPPYSAYRGWDRGRVHWWNSRPYHWYGGSWVIYNDLLPSYDYTSPTVVYAPSTYSGDTVANVQAALNREGYDAGPVDGVIGGQTRDAIEDYQEDHGLDETGRIDSALLSSLGL